MTYLVSIYRWPSPKAMITQDRYAPHSYREVKALSNRAPCWGRVQAGIETEIEMLLPMTLPMQAAVERHSRE